MCVSDELSLPKAKQPHFQAHDVYFSACVTNSVAWDWLLNCLIVVWPCETSWSDVIGSDILDHQIYGMIGVSSNMDSMAEEATGSKGGGTSRNWSDFLLQKCIPMEKP